MPLKDHLEVLEKARAYVLGINFKKDMIIFLYYINTLWFVNKFPNCMNNFYLIIFIYFCIKIIKQPYEVLYCIGIMDLDESFLHKRKEVGAKKGGFTSLYIHLHDIRFVLQYEGIHLLWPCYHPLNRCYSSLPFCISC